VYLEMGRPVGASALLLRRGSRLAAGRARLFRDAL
jgi:hypothetical protein